MKSFLTALAAVALAGGAARAEPSPPPHVLIGVGAGFPGVSFGAEWLFETAVTITPALPVRVHAMFARGQSDGEDYGAMLYYTVRGGAELVDCTPGRGACLILDGDLGLMHFYGRDYGPGGGADVGDPDRNGLLVGARGGLDTGGDSVRFRLVIDVAHAVTGRFLVHDTMGGARDMSTEVALQAELVIGF